MIYVCVQRQYLTADCEWKYDISHEGEWKMKHFMNLVLIKNIYIGIPMAALLCYLFLFFCFLNQPGDTVLVSCITDGTFYDPDTDIWIFVPLSWHPGKGQISGWLYGCDGVSCPAECFYRLYSPTAGSADHGEWRYILPLSCKNRHLVAGSSRDNSVSVCNAACP